MMLSIIDGMWVCVLSPMVHYWIFLHRIRCFGVTLSQMDIRQESTRHTDAIAEITRYLGIGDYAQWSEAEKQSFLVAVN